MAEKKTTTKTAAATTKKAAAPKKACATKKTCATKKVAAPSVDITEYNIGFRAGDVYQAIAAAENGLSVAEITKKAGISTEETYLGLGWLLKEGKIASVDGLVVLK